MSPTEWVFFWVSIVSGIVIAAVFPAIYRRGRVATYVGALCISWVPVQLIAFVAEGRRMWLPGEHSAIFFWGDSVLLPLTAVALAWMRQEWLRQGHAGVPLADRWAWRAGVIVVSVAVAVAFHASQILTWSPDALRAPSKVWHDYLVYPVFCYVLLSQAPFLWQVSWRRSRIQPALVSLALLGVAGWATLGHVYDPAHVHDRRPLLIVASPPLAVSAADGMPVSAGRWTIAA